MKKLIIILMALIAYSTHVFADKVSFTASAPDEIGRASCRERV